MEASSTQIIKAVSKGDKNAAVADTEKKVQKAVTRRTVDTSIPYIKLALARLSYARPLEHAVHQPVLASSLEVMPPVGYTNCPASNFDTKFVHNSFNKARSPVKQVVWTPDGRRIMSGMNSGEFTLWNGSNLNFETVLQAHEAAVRCMVYSHNEQFLLSSDDNGRVKVRQCSCSLLTNFWARQVPYYVVCDCLRARLSVGPVVCGPGCLWARLSVGPVVCGPGCLRARLSVGPVVCGPGCLRARLSAGLVVCGPGCLWARLSAGPVVCGPGCLRARPTDKKFATSSDDSTIKVHDFSKGPEITMTGHGGDVRSIDWHHSKGLIASGSKDSLVKLWDPRTGSCMATLHGHKNGLMQVRWNQNGNWLLSASKDQLLKVFDVRMQREVGTYRGNTRDVMSCCWHPVHEELFASGSHEGTISFWMVSRSEVQAQLLGAHEREVWSLAWHPIGHMLASGGQDQATKFWCRTRPGDIWRDRQQRDEDAGSVTAAVAALAALTGGAGGDSEAVAAVARPAVIPGIGQVQTTAVAGKVQPGDGRSHCLCPSFKCHCPLSNILANSSLMGTEEGSKAEVALGEVLPLGIGKGHLPIERAERQMVAMGEGEAKVGLVAWLKGMGRMVEEMEALGLGTDLDLGSLVVEKEGGEIEALGLVIDLDLGSLVVEREGEEMEALDLGTDQDLGSLVVEKEGEEMEALGLVIDLDLGSLGEEEEGGEMEALGLGTDLDLGSLVMEEECEEMEAPGLMIDLDLGSLVVEEEGEEMEALGLVIDMDLGSSVVEKEGEEEGVEGGETGEGGGEEMEMGDKLDTSVNGNQTQTSPRTHTREDPTFGVEAVPHLRPHSGLKATGHSGMKLILSLLLALDAIHASGTMGVGGGKGGSIQVVARVIGAQVGGGGGEVPHTILDEVALGTVAHGKVALGKVALGRVAHAKEALRKGALGEVALGKEALRKMALRKKEALRKVVLGEVALGKVALGKVALGKVALGRVALAKEALRKVALGEVARRKMALGKVALGRVPLAKVALGKVVLGKEALVKVALGRVALAKVALGKVALGRVALGKAAGPRQGGSREGGPRERGPRQGGSREGGPWEGGSKQN
eukprot:gene23176-30387_t